MEIVVVRDRAYIKNKDIGVDLSGKEYWEKHDILLDYIEDNKLGTCCIVPYDCDGGCQVISCPRNFGTMGG